MLPHSIRWRLQSWLAVLLLVLLTGFGFSIHQLEKNARLRAFDEELQARVSALSIAMRDGRRPPGPPPSPPGGFPGPPRKPPPGRPDGPFNPPELPVADLVAAFHDDGGRFYYRIWQRDREAASSPSASHANPTLPRGNDRDTTLKFRDRGRFREAYHFTERGDCVLVGRSLDDLETALRRLALLVSSAGIAVLAAGLAGGAWLTRQVTRPIDDISETARRISAGNLDERIPIGGDHELGRLAAVLNSTFSRLGEAFDRQKQFTTDASHELRTPITMILAEAQSALTHDRTPDEYKDALTGCLDAAQQMRRITEALLQLARADAGEPSDRTTFDMTDPIEEIAAILHPRLQRQGLRLELALSSTPAFGNPAAFAIVVSNLLENAIHYNKPHGFIHVSCAPTPTGPRLTVKDSGIGIDSQDLPHVFERFYRADKARSRSEGRFGLGLAICHGIVTAEGGAISAHSQPGIGTLFTVTYPPPPP